MSKTVQVETEDDFFARMRKVAGQIDRHEFVGSYENVSFEDADEMCAYVEKEARQEAAKGVIWKPRSAKGQFLTVKARKALSTPRENLTVWNGKLVASKGSLVGPVARKKGKNQV
ncbi:hypothetical protein [Azomonas macrocytogenes]|uniref:Uncharacterized protein n=1 Tax=Azomonas macrocytogenes TaxID=69962 RepID=A0A839T8N3_AZOMA|nr:hypothetical protein [Azomonas macrocytogenes]MBB3105240.1 hypothetical protein [Azomonas macrocytogenes]